MFNYDYTKNKGWIVSCALNHINVTHTQDVIINAKVKIMDIYGLIRHG